MNLFTQPPLGADPKAVTDDQRANNQLGVNRRTANGTVARFQMLAEETQVEEMMNAPKQVVLRNMVLHTEGVEQLLATRCLPIHHGLIPSQTMP